MSATPSKRKRSTDASLALRQDIGDNFRYLEFYAGVGGWRMALNDAVLVHPDKNDGNGNSNSNKAGEICFESMICVAALDHSDLCLEVYDHNFGADKKRKSCRIEQIKLEQLEGNWRADAWFMSPPCQPHTRQHGKQSADLNDPRSSSFLHICKLLEKIADDALPTMICLENVVGFEDSNSCRIWRQVLSKRSYAVAHFHWNPTQVNLPNDRPRYFCLAVLEKELQIPHTALNGILTAETDLDLAPKIQGSLTALNVKDESEGRLDEMPCIRDFLDSSTSTDSHVKVPDKLLERNASWCFDIVTPESQRSACFTSGYGKFVKGTGSVLYTGDKRNKGVDFTLQRPEDRSFQPNWAESLQGGSLRYLSGLEIARLMGFASSFSFPDSCTPKQQWKLVGNSLNVRLTSRLITLGLLLCGKLSLENAGFTVFSEDTTAE